MNQEIFEWLIIEVFGLLTVGLLLFVVGAIASVLLVLLHNNLSIGGWMALWGIVCLWWGIWLFVVLLCVEGIE